MSSAPVRRMPHRRPGAVSLDSRSHGSRLRIVETDAQAALARIEHEATHGHDGEDDRGDYLDDEGEDEDEIARMSIKHSELVIGQASLPATGYGAAPTLAPGRWSPSASTRGRSCPS